MYHLIRLFRMPIYDGVIPPLSEVVLTGAICLVTLLFSWIFFTRKADEFAYRI
jgi:ABC-type polysaccharide/polyol phosphate export permease